MNLTYQQCDKESQQHQGLPTAQHQQMPRGYQNAMLSSVCPANRGVCLDGMGPVHREKHQICGERAATGCTLREERLPTTQQCNHHAGKLELGVPCEQAGGSQARNVLSDYKQLSRRNNIRTHSRSYTHQRQHTSLLTTIHPHVSLQTLLLSKHHQMMEQMHTTIS